MIAFPVHVNEDSRECPPSTKEYQYCDIDVTKGNENVKEFDGYIFNSSSRGFHFQWKKEPTKSIKIFIKSVMEFPAEDIYCCYRHFHLQGRIYSNCIPITHEGFLLIHFFFPIPHHSTGVHPNIHDHQLIPFFLGPYKCKRNIGQGFDEGDD